MISSIKVAAPSGSTKLKITIETIVEIKVPMTMVRVYEPSASFKEINPPRIFFDFEIETIPVITIAKRIKNPNHHSIKRFGLTAHTIMVKSASPNPR